MNNAKFQEVYSDLTLYTTPDKFFIEPKAGEELMVIERNSENIICFKSDHRHLIPAANSRKDFCGLIGIIQLLACPYLVVAVQRELVGYIAGCAVWRLAKAELIPYRSCAHLSPEKQADNDVYLSMVYSVLSTPFLYFSYDYDLTHSLQRLHGISPDFWKQSLFERADQRFVWNGNLLYSFKGFSIHRFCLPLMHGFVSINFCVVNGHSLNWSIVSRRSIQRAGTRLHRRGLDKEGNVANFVETEQIVEYQGDRASFVQIRGSIPLFWQQDPDLRYKPPPTLLDVDPQDQHSMCLKHMNDLMTFYGKIVCVNLVDQKGAEGNMEVAFKNAITNVSSPSVKYESFDFHAECSKMRWDRLSILIDRLAHDQDEMSFFLLLRDGSLSSLQDGVFRTNCIDCLDRTNVVQSMLAHRNLESVLRKLQILHQNQTLEFQYSFEVLFKNVWADNADIISTQYSGTGALKTDFTRTGKRTRYGLLQDGMNSLTRYYKNNFADGLRQDGIDLFLGNGKPVSPLHIDKGWKYVTYPSILLIAVAMFVACAVTPSEYSTDSLLFLLFWGSMVYATLHTILKYGSEFVDKPRLTHS
ncbi:unnamed protein product [Phyllotreta striolata]|uniref:Phosphatidylinositol-3-phosphatase SAC1 n=1 Tax=Phyllotreta striolata TaxID=444603 RepID=A0A9N9XMY0_PHYSR|nr:unnamed protein product [Phyllotreta striolata]